MHSQESYDRYRELVEKNEAAVKSPPRSPGRGTRAPLPRFEELDKNRDGVIDRKEFQQGMAAMQQGHQGHVTRNEAASRPWEFQPEVRSACFPAPGPLPN